MIQCNYVFYTFDFFQSLYIFQKQFLTLLSGFLCKRYKTTISLVSSPLLKKENHLACHKRFSVIVTKWTLLKSSGIQEALCSRGIDVTKGECGRWDATC